MSKTIVMEGGEVEISDEGKMLMAKRFGPDPQLDCIPPGLIVEHSGFNTKYPGPYRWGVFKRQTEPNNDVPEVYDAYVMAQYKMSIEGNSVCVTAYGHPSTAGYVKSGTNIQVKGIGHGHHFVVYADLERTL